MRGIEQIKCSQGDLSTFNMWLKRAQKLRLAAVEKDYDDERWAKAIRLSYIMEARIIGLSEFLKRQMYN